MTLNRIPTDMIIDRGSGQKLNEKLNDVTTQLAQKTTEIELAGTTTPTTLRMVFQYNNETDVSKIKRLKQMGFNVVLVPNAISWQTDLTKMTAFLDLHLKYGVYVIPELNTTKLMGVNFTEEQAWITSLENHPAIIGFYSFDEPVYNSVSKANQELVYNRIKAVTVKNVYMSDVPFVTPRLSMFQTYYTEKAFDVYMINGYWSHETVANIKSAIIECMTNLKNTSGIIPPKVIIPSLPFYTDPGYNYPPTESTARAHIDGWRPFVNGSYAVFGHDNILLVTTLDTNEDYRKLVSTLPGYFSSNLTDGKTYFSDTLKAYKSADLSGGVNIGNGTLLKKYLIGVGTLNFGTVPANSTTVLTLTATGASQGDCVICNPLVPPPVGTVWNAYVSAPNTVTIRLANVTASPIVVVSTTWYTDVLVR
jgi:hypothetical protein